MKKTTFLISFLMLVLIGFVHAQEKTGSDQAQVKPDQYADFSPGWYIGINGGLNWFLGDGNDFLESSNGSVNISKSTGCLGRFELGYQFTPVFGVRTLLGFNRYNQYVKFLRAKKNRAFNAESLTADLIWNLSAIHANHPTKWDFSLFGGLGGFYMNNNTDKSSLALALRGGAQLGYKLSPVLSLNLIADANVTTENFNDQGGELPFDFTPSLTMGIIYHIHGK